MVHHLQMFAPDSPLGFFLFLLLCSSFLPSKFPVSHLFKFLSMQRRHALRCYCQAMQVYKDRGWSLAEDHINFTIGRQSFTLSQPENAVTAFTQILTNESRQTATQQGAFLREYLYVYKVTTVCIYKKK